MFLDLPRDLQIRIYEKHLKIGDRFRLNTALKSEQQFNENRDRDCKIALIKYGFTHNILTSNLSVELAKFVSDNKDDPTIREIIIENNIAIVESENGKDNRFINWLLDPNPDPGPIRGLINIELISDVRVICRNIAQYCNPSKFNLLMKNELFISYFKIIDIDGFIFDILNMDNLELLHSCHENYYNFFEKGFDYSSNLLRLFVLRTKTVKFYLKNIHTSDYLEKELIDESVKRMNPELLQYLLTNY